MALFDALTTPGTVYRRMPQHDFGPVGKEHEHTRELLESHRVWVDRSLHQRLDFSPKTVNFTKDFGELHLPFPSMWIEWYNEQYNMHMAIHCMEMPWSIRHPEGMDYGWLAFPYMFHPSDSDKVEFRNMPTLYNQVLELDFNGTEMLGVRGLHWDGHEFNPLDTTLKVDDDGFFRATVSEGDNIKLGSLIDICWNGLVAIGFMNCKNVRTERVERKARQPKKARRQRPDKADYHTIVLPRSAYAGHYEPTGEHRELAMHYVRGHFKTFTAEAPLLGKHVGTYWWAHQLRGNPDIGVVEADYKVAN